jgi:hypothetical protein
MQWKSQQSMKTFKWPVLLVVLLPFLFSSSIHAQSLTELLNAVSQNVMRFEDLIPDFVCNETVSSTQYESGKAVKQKVVESIFTGVQRSNEQNKMRFAFVESREVVAIDGKPVGKVTPFPKLPYRFAGGYSSLLITTFAPENLEVHTYSIGDRYRSGKSGAVLIKFATKEGQQKLRSMLQGTQVLSKDVGAAWIDLETFQVTRLQRQSLNLPSDLSRSMVTVDYGPVTIDENTFWIPMKVRAEVTERNSPSSVSYIAEYSDCKKFTADIKFLPSP